MGFCIRYRQVRRYVKRGFIRKGLFVMLCFQFVLGLMLAAFLLRTSALDKANEQIEQNLHSVQSLQAELTEAKRQNRVMLDARANIQTTIVETGCRREIFTRHEIDLISLNWKEAEYDVIKPNTMANCKSFEDTGSKQ